MNQKLSAKLADLPKSPGVYFFKNSAAETIYIGKAAVLRNRVRQYFQKSRLPDPKTEALVAEISDLDWVEVESEVDALFLEAEMVRRYLPRYNVLLRDDKSLLFVRIDIKSQHPTVTTVRRPLDDGAEYFGPYLNGFALKRALRYLRRAFPYSINKPQTKNRASLYYHIGLDPGLEEGRTSLNEYRRNLKQLIKYLKGERRSLIKELEKNMRSSAKKQDFEQAAKYRNQLNVLNQLAHKIIFSDREFLDVSKDQALNGLAELFNLHSPPKRIEAYDISHMQGTDTVASMVVFSFGLPDKSQYRKFKLSSGNDDFLHMKEVLSRRFSSSNIKKWGHPNLVLIDGGKGQLSSAIEVILAVRPGLPVFGLAKREEEIILKNDYRGIDTDKINEKLIISSGGFLSQENGQFTKILLPKNSDIVKLLQRVRDESHRFAVSYHSSLKRSRLSKSVFDEIPGIGPKTKKTLLKKFGSLAGVKQASVNQLEQAIGKSKAKIVSNFFNESNRRS